MIYAVHCTTYSNKNWARKTYGLLCKLYRNSLFKQNKVTVSDINLANAFNAKKSFYKVALARDKIIHLDFKHSANFSRFITTYCTMHDSQAVTKLL